MFSLHYQAIPSTDPRRSTRCRVPAACLETPLLVHRRDLACYGIRMCDVAVDVGAVEIAFWQASQAVRILKRDVASWRRQAGNSPLVYNKTYAYSNPLH